MTDASAELLFLSQALRAHLEWQQQTGATALIPCDNEWLEQRRQRYREFVLEDDPTLAASVPTEHAESQIRVDASNAEASPSPAPELSSARSSTEAPVELIAAQARGEQAERDLAARVPTAERIPAERTAERAQPPSPATSAFEAYVPPRTAPEPAATSEQLQPAPSQVAVQPSPASAAMARSETVGPRAQPVVPRAESEVRPASSWDQVLSPFTLSEEGVVLLRTLADEVKSCTRCGLHSTRKNTVFSRGTGRSGVCFVGEGPGADEDAQGIPFVGAAGQLLDKMIAAMGFARDDVYVCNVIKCRPPKNRKPTQEEMNTCRGYLFEQLEWMQPRVIVAMGATAVQGLLGLTMGITRLRGKWRLYRASIPVMPTFHPAYLLRQPSAKREVWSDLQQVLEHLGLEAPKRTRRG